VNAKEKFVRLLFSFGWLVLLGFILVSHYIHLVRRAHAYVRGGISCWWNVLVSLILA
jgi:hypothetical protein